ncbi:ADP-ribosylglycohydrolase family protein [Butyrivibrio sp. MC2013]|uniref:ADP-ribosylglycohydrolase family protein n=1 Tax=Butyrivibrio sp. MC2013 TaxID=1280686 RepID=UPI0003FE1662|nr:ADP-ribosylglycohydrolase family protein [Butyrivibrio sp. MC2013]
MYGAILGDMVGAPYEFDQGDKSKDFEMWNSSVHFTDDTVMTIAIADGIMTAGLEAQETELKESVVNKMQAWGRRYLDAGYGARFIHWLVSNRPMPYGSYGNGSAMRVSPVGWLYESPEKTREVARWTAEVTHNHPEGIKGAEAVASVIFMARNGATKEEIKQYVVDEFNYDLSRNCDEIRPFYYHDESCQKTVPEAITAFLEGDDFEDVIRTAVSLGGDCDTLTCIAGAMAEAFYGVPVVMVQKTMERLEDDMLEVIRSFNKAKKYHK